MSMSLEAVQTQSLIQTAVARKSLDAAEAKGEMIVGMLKEAVKVGAESRGAVSAVAGVGETGQLLDVLA